MDWLMNFIAHPPALDPTMVPFVAKLIGGNIITIGVIWAILKYCAYKSEWAGDDKILQFLSGMFSAIRQAMPNRKQSGVPDVNPLSPLEDGDDFPQNK